MINFIHNLKEEHNRRQNENKVARDDEGRAIIEMTIHDDETFLSPYSRNAVNTISEDTAEFLRNSALCFSYKEQISLRLYSNCIDEREKRIYPEAIRSYFKNHLSDARRELRRNAHQSLAMFFIGLLALTVMFLGEFLGWNQIWLECIDIFAWVFVWETVDLFFLERTTLRHKMKRYLAFLNLHVDFYPLDDETLFVKNTN